MIRSIIYQFCVEKLQTRSSIGCAWERLEIYFRGPKGLMSLFMIVAFGSGCFPINFCNGDLWVHTAEVMAFVSSETYDHTHKYTHETIVYVVECLPLVTVSSWSFSPLDPFGASLDSRWCLMPFQFALTPDILGTVLVCTNLAFVVYSSSRLFLSKTKKEEQSEKESSKAPLNSEIGVASWAPHVNQQQECGLLVTVCLSEEHMVALELEPEFRGRDLGFIYLTCS